MKNRVIENVLYMYTILLLISISAIAQSEQPVLAEADGVILTASTPQRTMLLWQPLVINLKIENKSSQVYEIYEQTYSPRGCEAYVIQPNSDKLLGCSKLMEGPIFEPKQTLAPGKTCYGRVYLDTCILGSLNSSVNEQAAVPLNMPGLHTIQLEWILYSVPPPEPDENGLVFPVVARTSVEIDVVEPAGRNLEAFNVWKRALMEVDFQGIPDSGPDAEALMTTYADTIYGQYIQYRNSTIQRTPTPANLPAPPKPGTPEYEFFLQPVAGYNAFLQKYPDFPLADKLMGEIAKFSSIENLQSLLDTLKQKYPYSVEIPGVESLLAERIESKRLREAGEAAKTAGQE